MNDTNDFFTALRDRRPNLLKTDGEALVEVAERRLCHAARDISMPGVAGSLLQMIEGAGVGATLDVDAVPRPVGVALERWLVTFPSFGFLLAAPEQHVQAAVGRFLARGLACAPCGHFDDTTTLKLASNGATAVAWDLAATPLTGISPSAGA
jgi:selenophosphate synthetase-related protein